VLDLGCGTGLLSLLLLQRQRELAVTGLELSPEAMALAKRAAAKNDLTDRLFFHQGDLRDRNALPAGPFDLAVCNPPYYPVNSGALTGEGARRTARAEADCTLEDICRAARRALRWGGRFCLVHKPERLTDLLCVLREAGLEPKRLRTVCVTAGGAPPPLPLGGREKICAPLRRSVSTTKRPSFFHRSSVPKMEPPSNCICSKAMFPAL